MNDNLDEFLEWLEQQKYWVNRKKVEKEWPDIEYAESAGITCKENEEGDVMIPRRDLRHLSKKAAYEEQQ